jgi:hypothetical protein
MFIILFVVELCGGYNSNDQIDGSCNVNVQQQCTIVRQQASTTKQRQDQLRQSISRAQFMARDCPSSSQRSPTRQNDVTLRLDQLGQDDTFLLGDHSYDNFLDGLHDEVSFAVPKFYDQCQTRTNGVIGRPRVEAAEPVVLRVVPTPSGSRPRVLDPAREL